MNELPTIKDMAIAQVEILHKNQMSIACPTLDKKQEWEHTVFIYAETLIIKSIKSEVKK